MSPRNLSIAAFCVLAVAVIGAVSPQFRFIFAKQDARPVESSGTPTIGGPIPASPQKGFVRVAWTPVPDTTAHAVLLFDLSTGETLYNVNPGLRWPAASLTKLMSADVLLDGMDPAKIITVTREDMAVGGNAQTRDLRAGETYRAEDLLKLMLISSSNEAAEALARDYGRDRLLSEMNARAGSWGLRDTRFLDPAGISPENQTTAEEWKIIVGRIRLAHPGHSYRPTVLPGLPSSWEARPERRRRRKKICSPYGARKDGR